MKAKEWGTGIAFGVLYALALIQGNYGVIPFIFILQVIVAWVLEF